MRLDRLLAITVILLNRDRISARELADKFEVSVRTIYRDVDAINLAGIPVISYPGTNGGFGIMDNFRIDRQLLTLKDMLSILTVLKGISSGYPGELDTAIEKITGLIPGDQKNEIKLHFEKIAMDILPWGMSRSNLEKIRTLREAINSCNALFISYRNTNCIATGRTIEPMTLVLQGYVWYLFAYCRYRNSFRVFRISRITDIEKTGETFIRKDESYSEYFKKMEGREGVALLLKFSPDARTRVEDFFSEDQIEYLDDGKLLVQVSYPEDEWVYSTILSYGEHVEVLEPLHIRKKILEKSKKISAIYKHDIQLSKP